MISTTKPLAGKIALVTGAAHRLGKAIALALASASAHIVVHYNTSTEAATATAAEIDALGVEALTVQADLHQSEAVVDLFDQVREHFGSLDILVNSASIMERIALLDLTPADWERALATNLTNPFLCIQQAAKLMTAGGVIINIADVAGLKPWKTYPAHSVSKAGLLMLTQVAAQALAPAIRVNAIAPGQVLKPPEWDEARWTRLSKRTLLEKTGSPYHVVQTVLFLITNDYVTGEVLVVDGGSRFR